MQTETRERGFTLTEVLVATAIFTIIMLAALLMYDRNNRVFKSGVEASDVQQNTRVGFDKLVSDLRIEGFDYNRNGSPTGSDPTTGVNYQRQSDEQIEYMGDAAITFRANFNYSDPTVPENGREVAYQSPAFPLVTTSNKEIVTYALKSADPTKNTGTIMFYADVSKKRIAYVGTGGTPKERKVVISGYDLTNANPPYTLYRLTLKDADIADSDPNPVGDAVALATNIRSMTFHYYSDQGGNAATEIPPVYGDGQYDATLPGASIVQRTTRASIQSIRVDLIGMNAVPDVNYASPLEPSSGPYSHYREYELTSLVVPRNVGKRAVKEESLTPPKPAKLTAICWGACGVPYITWQSPVDGNVDFYSIIYDTDPNGSFSQGYPVGNVTAAYFPRPLDPGTTYYFKIEASNGYGDSISGETGMIKPLNGTTPKPPTKVGSQGATTNQTNKVTLTFTAPSYYTDASPQFACVAPDGSSAGTNAVSTLGIAPPENIAYRIYRSTTSANFDPTKGEGTLIASEANGVQPYVDVSGVGTFTDIVPACTNVYYRVQAVKGSCIGNANNNSPANVATSQSDFLPAIGSAAFTGTATTTVKPSAPANLKITRTPAATCPPVSSTIGPNVTCGLSLSWDKVVTDTAGSTIKVGTYTVTRKQLQPSGGTTVSFTADGQWDQPGNSVTWTDTTNPPVFATDASGISYQYEYDVVANSCSGLSSAAAVSTEPSCYFALTNPITATTTNGGNGTNAFPYLLYGGSSTINFTGTGLTNVTVNLSSGGVAIGTSQGSNSPFVFTWPPGFTAGQIVQLDFQAQKSGCYYTQTIWAMENGGVCDYTTAPNGVPNPTQVNTGATAATAWQLKPNDSISFSASDLASTNGSITDTTNGNVVKTFTLSGTSETFTWPTSGLTYGTTYKVDFTLNSTSSCQRIKTYYVTQVCAAYGGGTPTFSSGDVSHTGLTVANAWQLGVGSTFTVTESVGMKNVKLTVTDITSSTSFGTTTYSAPGTKTFTWPPTGVTATPNHVFQLDFVLVDVNGCTSATYTRYLTQSCTYSGGAPTIAALSTTLRKTGDTSGNGLAVGTPAQMAPNIDMVSVTEAKMVKAYVDYVDTSGNALAGVTSQTVIASGGVAKFSNPRVPSYNGLVYVLNITLEDSSGCKSSKYSFYVKQAPCVLLPAQNASDTSVIGFTAKNNGPTTVTVTITNLANQALTVNNVLITFTTPLPTHKSGCCQVASHLTNVTMPNNTFSNLTVTTSPYTVTPVSAETIPAKGTWSFTISFEHEAVVEPVTGICVTYTTSVNTPTTTTQQSCSVQFNASGQYASSNNPLSCD